MQRCIGRRRKVEMLRIQSPRRGPSAPHRLRGQGGAPPPRRMRLGQKLSLPSRPGPSVRTLPLALLPRRPLPSAPRHSQPSSRQLGVMEGIWASQGSTATPTGMCHLATWRRPRQGHARAVGISGPQQKGARKLEFSGGLSGRPCPFLVTTSSSAALTLKPKPFVSHGLLFVVLS